MARAETEQTRIDSFWGLIQQDKSDIDSSMNSISPEYLSRPITTEAQTANSVYLGWNADRQQPEKNIQDEQRKGTEFYEEKRQYMELFYRAPHHPSERIRKSAQSRNMFCGQGNSFSKNPSQVSAMLAQAMESQHSGGEPANPVRLYGPYVSRIVSRGLTVKYASTASASKGARLHNPTLPVY